MFRCVMCVSGVEDYCPRSSLKLGEYDKVVRNRLCCAVRLPMSSRCSTPMTKLHNRHYAVPVDVMIAMVVEVGRGGESAGGGIITFSEDAV